jgi:hypothetical protein
MKMFIAALGLVALGGANRDPGETTQFQQQGVVPPQIVGVPQDVIDMLPKTSPAGRPLPRLVSLTAVPGLADASLLALSKGGGGIVGPSLPPRGGDLPPMTPCERRAWVCASEYNYCVRSCSGTCGINNILGICSFCIQACQSEYDRCMAGCQ